MLVRERHLIIFVRNFRMCGKIGSPLSSIVKSSYAKGSIGMKSRKKYEKKKIKKNRRSKKKKKVPFEKYQTAYLHFFTELPKY